MNRGEIRDAVRDAIGETTPDFWSDAQLNGYITEALFRFSKAERWPWLTTEGSATLLGSDDGRIELTEGVALAHHIAFTLLKDGTTRSYQPKRVDPVTGFRLASSYAAGTYRAYPDYFYVVAVADDDDNGEFTYVAQFVPQPSSDMDVTFLYYRKPPALDADNAVPDMPEEFHRALVHYAAGLAWEKELNGATKAQEQFQMYATVLDDARGEHLEQADDDPLIMGHEEPQIEQEYGSNYVRDTYDLHFPETLGP